MKTTLRLITLVAVSALATGCVFIPVKSSNGKLGSSSSALKSSRPECKPSQYWDGNQCRHKGNGKGARKHDG